MFKSHVLFSLALGGLVIAGCSKDENPAPVQPPASAPSAAPATVPSTEPAAPTTSPASAPSASASPDNVKALVADVEKKGSDALPTIAKIVPTTNPIPDANK